jgi:hypothetical protein
MVNQETVSPASMAVWPRASVKWLLPVPEGPQMQKFSRRPIHSRDLRASWVGRGMADLVSSQSPKVLPVGKPARLRGVWRLARSAR